MHAQQQMHLARPWSAVVGHTESERSAPLLMLSPKALQSKWASPRITTCGSSCVHVRSLARPADSRPGCPPRTGTTFELPAAPAAWAACWCFEGSGSAPAAGGVRMPAGSGSGSAALSMTPLFCAGARVYASSSGGVGSRARAPASHPAGSKTVDEGFGANLRKAKTRSRNKFTLWAITSLPWIFHTA